MSFAFTYKRPSNERKNFRLKALHKIDHCGLFTKVKFLQMLFKRQWSQKRGSKVVEKIDFKNSFHLGSFSKYFIGVVNITYTLITHIRHLNKLSGFI